MATIKEVFQMIRTGCNAAEILNGLQIPPSRLWEIMDSRRMVKLLALQERVTQVGMRLTATTNGLKAAGRLAGMAEGHIPELARRACVHLLEQVRKTEQKGTGYGVRGTGEKQQKQGPWTGDQGLGEERSKQGSGEKKQTQRRKQQQKQQQQEQQVETAQPTQGLGVELRAGMGVERCAGMGVELRAGMGVEQCAELRFEQRAEHCDAGVSGVGGMHVSAGINGSWEDLCLSLGRLDSFGNVEFCCETLRNVEGLGGTLRIVGERLDAAGYIKVPVSKPYDP